MSESESPVDSPHPDTGGGSAEKRVEGMYLSEVGRFALFDPENTDAWIMTDAPIDRRCLR